jgi:hypothetical protein
MSSGGGEHTWWQDERESYTNFGMLDRLLDINLIPLCMDTWYFESLTQVGTMDVGTGGVQLATHVGEFLAVQLQRFAAAFADVVRFRPGVHILFKEKLPSVRSFVLDLEADASTLRSMVSEQVHPTAYVQALSARLDVRAAIRRYDGMVSDYWLTNIGDVTFVAGLDRDASVRALSTGNSDWTAILTVEVVSLFQRDNRKQLRTVRRRWEQLRAENPALIWDDDDAGSTLVTLRYPPPGTPDDNQELWALNAPRLQAAVHSWELQTGAPFHWRVDIDGEETPS